MFVEATACTRVVQLLALDDYVVVRPRGHHFLNLAGRLASLLARFGWPMVQAKKAGGVRGPIGLLTITRLVKSIQVLFGAIRSSPTGTPGTP